MAWHVYDIQFESFEPFATPGYQLARFAVTKDEGLATYQIRIKIRPSLREALAGKVSDYSDRDLAGGLGAQTILTLLERGIEPFEHDIVLDASHYPGRPGEPAIRPDYEHLTVRVEPTPEGEVVPPLKPQAPSQPG